MNVRLGNIGRRKSVPILFSLVFALSAHVSLVLQDTRAESLTTTAASGATATNAARSPRNLSDLQKLDRLVRSAAEKTLKATVSVRVRQRPGGSALGSGVLVSEDGYVLTAAHVAGSPDQRVFFRFQDGRTARGITLGINQDLDMGMMKITDPGPWPFLRLARSQDIKAGDWCLATGHPGVFGQDDPAALIRLGRILKTTRKAFLTDCTLVGGDSGGPLVDLSGNVIAVHSRIGADLTTNLHIPVDRYTESWERLVNKQVWGLMVRPWIGVEQGQAAEGVVGASVRRVRRESPAEQAGLQAGDLVVRFADQRVRSFQELKSLVGDRQPGEKVAIQVQRGSINIESLIEIGKRQIAQSAQTRDDADLLRDWLDGIDRRRRGGRAVVTIGKNSDQVKEAFQDALIRASRSTVKVLAGGRMVALGTIVDRNGLIVTKASQLEGELRCHYRGSRSFSVKKIAELRSHDLALLKADRQLPAIAFHSIDAPERGALLASSSLNVWPLAVGVTSGQPVEVPSEGKLGIVMGDQTNLPLVSQIVADSGADRAGVQIGDIIVAINSQSVSTAAQLISEIGKQYPGDLVRLTVDRGGTLVELRVELGRFSEFDKAMAEFEDFIGGRLSGRRTGFSRVVQHDTALLPHNCGGPVVDSHGRFVGINIARAARTTSYLLPAADVVAAVEQLKASRTDTLQTVDVAGNP